MSSSDRHRQGIELTLSVLSVVCLVPGSLTLVALGLASAPEGGDRSLWWVGVGLLPIATVVALHLWRYRWRRLPSARTELTLSVLGVTFCLISGVPLALIYPYLAAANVLAGVAIVALYVLRRRRRSLPPPHTEQMKEEMRDLSSSAHVSPAPPEASPPAEPARLFLYVERLKLVNIRCFKELDLSFESPNGLLLTTLIIGENATGKSTVLRSLAVGLCPESDAGSLMKSLPGSLLRSGESTGSITVSLRSSDGGWSGSIETRIESERGETERVRQKVNPSDFPWHEVFVCAYGTQRTAQGGPSHEKYTARLAVASLFDNSALLQNPELILLRKGERLRPQIEELVREVLMLDEEEHPIRLADAIRGANGELVDHPGYWWLAFSPENLLPSCEICNQPSEIDGRKIGKHNRFPIEGRRAEAPGDRLEEEEPLLLNPLQDFTEKHLRVVVGGDDEGLIVAEDEHGKESARGKVCIDVFALNLRDQLVDGRKTAIDRVRALVAKYILSPAERKRVESELRAILRGEKAYTLASRAVYRDIKPLFSLSES